MMSQSEAIKTAIGAAELGKIDHNKRNVYVVQLMGVRVVERIPREVRAELNCAVKAGEIGHIPKDGLRPECYHHKNARGNALELRDKIYHEARAAAMAARAAIMTATSKICCDD